MDMKEAGVSVVLNDASDGTCKTFLFCSRIVLSKWELCGGSRGTDRDESCRGCV